MNTTDTPRLQTFVLLSQCSLKPLLSTLFFIRHLTLSQNNITSEHTWHLVLMLCFSELLRLNIAYNQIGPGIPLLASALRYTKQLEYLKLKECHVTSQGLLSLGYNLANNDTLHTLQISRNPYSTATFTTFLQMLKHNRKMRMISTSKLTSEHIDAISEINRTRSQKNLPQLKVSEEPQKRAFFGFTHL